METFASTILSLKGRFHILIVTDSRGKKQIAIAIRVLCKSQLEFPVKAEFWGRYFFQFMSTMLSLNHK